ncbi:hypothetical protein [Desulfoglaeba alkanexedens]|uniref:Uncharacterized protein n=1 Tax=Desulfoglaeba alkanexedens ALDC TaxID=980445 RepID=A0A4P8L2W8_9BACT|nr:hypothetical protein [Desulfoglaeba alkanexedens]QCQ21112.1 hypothetical protein FDQ92_02200 [Desulfoglaeba alkanexedens ALDC]
MTDEKRHLRLTTTYRGKPHVIQDQAELRVVKIRLSQMVNFRLSLRRVLDFSSKVMDSTQLPVALKISITATGCFGNY